MPKRTGHLILFLAVAFAVMQLYRNHETYGIWTLFRPELSPKQEHLISLKMEYKQVEKELASLKRQRGLSAGSGTSIHITQEKDLIRKRDELKAEISMYEAMINKEREPPP